jgi:hypothetical protein
MFHTTWCELDMSYLQNLKQFHFGVCERVLFIGTQFSNLYTENSLVGVKTNFHVNLTCFHTKSTRFHTKVWCELKPCFP